MILRIFIGAVLCHMASISSLVGAPCGGFYKQRSERVKGSAVRASPLGVTRCFHLSRKTDALIIIYASDLEKKMWF